MFGDNESVVPTVKFPHSESNKKIAQKVSVGKSGLVFVTNKTGIMNTARVSYLLT